MPVFILKPPPGTLGKGPARLDVSKAELERLLPSIYPGWSVEREAPEIDVMGRIAAFVARLCGSKKEFV